MSFRRDFIGLEQDVVLPATRGVIAMQLGLGALAGAVAALGQSPFSLVFLALPGFAGAFWMLWRSASPRGAAALGWAVGTGYFAVALNWIVEPFFVDAAHDAWMAPFAIVFLSAGLGLFWGAAAWLARWLVGRDGSPLALGIAWTAALSLAEYARGHVLTGFPWAAPGYIWVHTGLAQLGALVGPNGLNFLTIGFGAALTGVMFRTRVAWLGAVLGAVGPVLLATLLTTLTPPVPAAPTAPVIRLVQPNAPQDQKWQPAMIGKFYTRGLDLTSAPADPAPALVVWPETSLPDYLWRAGRILKQMSAAAHHAPMVVGAIREANGGLFNSLAVISPSGEVAGVYDKHHLVPFGEYTPLLPQVAALGWGGSFGTGFDAGPGEKLMNAGVGGPFLPLICYEVIFPNLVRSAPSRPAWLLQITNDAWFGNFSGPYQHLDQARMRAIESGLPLLRAANTGVTAVIDARGHILASLGLGKTGYLDARLPPALAPTPYWRFGDWPMLVLIAACLAATLYRRFTN